MKDETGDLKAEHPRDSALCLTGKVDGVAGEANRKPEIRVPKAAREMSGSERVN